MVLSEATVKGICEVMEKKQAEYGHAIYLITDEPYRELVYDDNIQVPYLMNYYKNTLVCYSFSKSLSLPGERIGYIAVCEEMEEWEDMYAAICGAGRSMGYVCAPSPVSYTHLDVYKRQLLTDAKSKPDLLSLMKFSISPRLQ